MPLTIGDFAIGAAVGVGGILLYQQLRRRRNPSDEYPVTVHPTAVLPDTPRGESGWYVTLRYSRRGGRIQAERGPYRSEQSANRAARRYERRYRGLVATVSRTGDGASAPAEGCACTQTAQENPSPDAMMTLASLALVGAGSGMMVYALMNKTSTPKLEVVPSFHQHEPQVLTA